jgi:hypothetical protein
MASRLVALGDRLAGQGFGLTNYGNLEAALNYLMGLGADIPSAPTITISSAEHGITGNTTISTINDSIGATAGQPLRLRIKGGPLQISSGIGNVKSLSGNTIVLLTNEVIDLVYDGANWWQVKPQPILIAFGTKASSVTTTGTTFAAGADLLAAALSFTADGISSYVMRASSSGLSTSAAAGTALNISINLDGADAGIYVNVNEPVTGYTVPFAGEGVFTPAAGAHTLNARVSGGAAGTITVQGGAGGAGVRTPIIVSLWRLAT